MLLYGHIVKKALEQKTLPMLKEVVDTALTARFGEEWYMYFARPIMEGYADFKDVDNVVMGGKDKAIEAFDISAICYLVMPYDKDLKMYLDGAMPMIEEKYGLEANPERLKRLRTISSNAFRGKIDVDMEENEMNAILGVQEKKWLIEIEKTLKEFDPEVTLEEYLSQLNQAVEANVARKREKEEALSKRPTYDEVREAYTKIRTFDFSDAPIGAPMIGKAPWTALAEELDKLPWPSVAGNDVAAAPAEEDEAVTEQVRSVAEGAAPKKPMDAAQAIAQAVVAGGLKLDDFVKPASGEETDKPAPGTAPNVEEAPEEVTGQEEVPAAEEEQKGKSKLFGWLKGKK